MSRKKRLLLLTSDSGFGHRSAASSIARALELRHAQEAEILVFNPILEENTIWFLRKSELNYDRTVVQSPGFYRFTYRISDSRPASSVVESALALLLRRNIQQILGKFSPDGILNTSQLLNAPIGAALYPLNPAPPFFTVVTDLGDVHSMWFNSAPDRFFVASQWVKAKALSCGIPPDKIVISGIPVDPGFGERPFPKAEMRLRLGLDPHLTTLLMVASRRVGGVIEHLEALERVGQPFQVAVIAGGDERLYVELSRRRWSFPIQIQNFIENMPEWMHAADILITKAGGLILSEGMAAGLPVILFDNLPGQEEDNVRFILENHAGARVETPMELKAVVESWLVFPQTRLQFFTANARSTGRPDSALVVADSLWQAAGMNVGPPIEISRDCARVSVDRYRRC